MIVVEALELLKSNLGWVLRINLFQLFCVFQPVHNETSGNALKKTQVRPSRRNKAEKAGIYVHNVIMVSPRGPGH